MSVIVPGMNMVHERVSIRPRNVSLYPSPPLSQPLHELLRAELQLVCMCRRESVRSPGGLGKARDPHPWSGSLFGVIMVPRPGPGSGEAALPGARDATSTLAE